MWALGIILFELTTKQQPISQIIEITDHKPIKIPSTLPPLIKALLEKLLDKNPATRPSAIEILNLPEVIEAGNRLAQQIKDIDPEMAAQIFRNPNQE